MFKYERNGESVYIPMYKKTNSLQNEHTCQSNNNVERHFNCS